MHFPSRWCWWWWWFPGSQTQEVCAREPIVSGHYRASSEPLEEAKMYLNRNMDGGPFLVYFLPILGGQKTAVSDSAEGWCAAPGLFPSHYPLIYVLFPSHSLWAESCSVRFSRGMVCSSWFISFPLSFNICFISFPFSWWAESCSVRFSTGMGRSRQPWSFQGVDPQGRPERMDRGRMTGTDRWRDGGWDERMEKTIAASGQNQRYYRSRLAGIRDLRTLWSPPKVSGGGGGGGHKKKTKLSNIFGWFWVCSQRYKSMIIVVYFISGFIASFSTIFLRKVATFFYGRSPLWL